MFHSTRKIMAKSDTGAFWGSTAEQKRTSI